MAGIRNLILQSVEPVAARRAMMQAIYRQSDYWRETLARCIRDECRHVYLFVTHIEGDISTFLYSGEKPETLAALPAFLGQGPAVGCYEGEQDLTDDPTLGYYRVSMFDIGTDVVAALKSNG